MQFLYFTERRWLCQETTKNQHSDQRLIWSLMALMRTKEVLLIAIVSPLKMRFSLTLDHDFMESCLRCPIESVVFTKSIMINFFFNSCFFSLAKHLELAFLWLSLILHASSFKKSIYYIKMKRYVHIENYALTRLFRAQLSLIRGKFERTMVWLGVTFERSLTWSEAVLSAQSSGEWAWIGLKQGCAILNNDLISIWSVVNSVWEGLIRELRAQFQYTRGSAYLH